MSDIPYTDLELVQRALKAARPFTVSEPRWMMAKRVFLTGRTASRAICEKYGFDPDQGVLPLTVVKD